MRTKIITIEGIDGCGKTVQIEMLQSALINLGYSVAQRSYPVYESFFGKQIGKYLSGTDKIKATDVDQFSMALWFALDRLEDFKDYVDGKTDFLIINRYVLSNAVYQSIRDCDIGKPDIVDWVFELEYGRFKLPRPTLNLFFDVDIDCARHNVGKKGFRSYIGSGRDVYENSSSIQHRARMKYLEIAERFDDIAIISCAENGIMLPKEAISEKVLFTLRERKILL